MDPSSPGPDSLFRRGRGAAALFIERLSVALASRMEKVWAATGVLTIACCCWPRQAGGACWVSSCSSLLVPLPLPALCGSGSEMGIALQPWLNAEEGLRAWLPASWLKSRHMCFFWWVETNWFWQSFFREFSQAQYEILRWKKFTLFFPPLLGQCGEDQLYFWVLGIHVCHCWACGCWGAYAVRMCLQYRNVVECDACSGLRLELFLGKKTSRQNWGGRHLFCPRHSVLADAEPVGWVLSLCVC